MMPTISRSALLCAVLFGTAPFAACTKKAPERHASPSTPAVAPTPAPTPAPAPAPTRDGEDLHRRRVAWRERGPLAPVMKVAAALTEAATRATLAATPSADPFAPFAGSVDKQLIEQLRRDQPTKLILMGLEFELVFFRGEKVELYLRTFLHPGAAGPEFFKIDGRAPKNGTIGVEHHPLADYRGHAEPFAAAARGLVAMLERGQCRKLPIVSPEPLQKIMQPGPLTLRMLSNLRAGERVRELFCQSLGKTFKAERYHLRLDDLTFGVLGAAGKIVGTLKGELRLKGGALQLVLQHYRSLTN